MTGAFAARVRPEERRRYVILGRMNAVAAVGWTAVAIATGFWFFGVLAVGCTVIAVTSLLAVRTLARSATADPRPRDVGHDDDA